MQTQSNQNNLVGKNTAKKDNSAGLEALKRDFSELGSIVLILKNLSSKPEKVDARNRHRFALTKIKKAIKVFKTDILEDKDMKVFKKLLTWERQRNLISVVDEYTLNELESATLKDNCECHNTPASGIRAQLGHKYRFVSYFDETRQKEMYITYIPVTIEPESRIDKKLEWKMSQGFMPEMKDYDTTEKILWHRRLLVDSEWQRYFREI